MKWGSKKSSKHSSSSSLSTLLIGRVFSVSWLSKFKQRGGDSADNSERMKERGDKDCSTMNSSLPTRWKEGRFYSMDGDWRLSFGEERAGGRRSTVGINPLWNDSNEDFQVPVSRLKNFGLKEMEENQNFNDMVLSVKKTKEKKVQQENGAFRSKKLNGDGGFTCPRRIVVKDRRLSRGIVREKRDVRADEGDGKSSMARERDIYVVEPNDMVQMKKDSWNSAVSNSRKQHRLASIEEDYAFETVDGEGCNTEWQNLEDEDIKEVNVKPQTPRKSTYIRRESHTKKVKQSNRVGAYSPRTECKIRALEDMKKTRMKSKKKAIREQIAERRNIFNSFAMVKSSFNPERDFRDSMVEMIREKGIRRPEELEELLACYLTLNSDEHHHLIIKVFRQVWFELLRDVKYGMATMS